MSRSTKLDLEPLLGALTGRVDDPTGDRILDATLATLVAGGLRRCTVEEVAERAGVGRSTVYRRFDGRDELIHAVLARELSAIFDAVAESVEHLDRIEDKLVDGFLAGLHRAEGSDFLVFLRSEPDLLMFLVEDSYRAIEVVTNLMVSQLVASVGTRTVDLLTARHCAEVVFRLAISFVLIPGSTLPLHDAAAARSALHRILDPLLRTAFQ